jgi:hypothetical protein
MKYQIDYEINGLHHSGDYRGSSAGEAFANCLLANPGATLLSAHKEGSFGKAYGHTEWSPPPSTRQPSEPPVKEPKPKEPKYKQTPDPMPSMREWARKHELI